jgi:hypothetical protein
MNRLGCKCNKADWCLGSLSVNQIDKKKSKINSLYHGDDGKLDKRVKKARLDEVIGTAVENSIKDNNINLTNTNQQVPLTFTETFYDEDKTTVQSFCEGCCAFFYDLPSRSFDRNKHEQKRIQILKSKMDIINRKYGYLPSVKKRKNVEEEGAFFPNILEARKYFNELKKRNLDHGFVSEFDMKEMCVPRSRPGSIECFRFLNEFFESNCDRPPNKTETICELPASTYSKLSIYKLYRKQCSILNGEDHQPISTSTFYRIWLLIFPNVKIIKYLSVAGKCKICAAIYRMEEECSSITQVKDLKLIKIYHRMTVQKCKNAYYRRRCLAQTQSEKYMSIISDGMQQEHSKLPYLANQTTCSSVVSQHIQGVKHHGFCKSMYRSYPHVVSGFNLNCHVILSEIFRRMKHCHDNGIMFPTELFIQVDGGSESTAKAMFGLCEYLIDEGIFRRVELSRLPVGHTHEVDISL